MNGSLSSQSITIVNGKMSLPARLGTKMSHVPQKCAHKN